MKIEIGKLYFASLYNRAKSKFNECIHSEENEFLQGEVGVSLELIILKEAYIKIVFFQETTDNFSLEICLTLHVFDKIIGEYIYFEDRNGNAVNDNLVFY